MTLRLGTLFAICLGLPVVGLFLARKPLAPYFAFPPELRDTGYPEFSLWLTVVYWTSVAVLLFAWFFLRIRVPVVTRSPEPQRRLFPVWGWIALGWQTLWWVLAWTRFPWFASLQPYTYAPLWLGFIILLNACIHWRGGTAPILADPRRFARLFALSAAFWWAFEFLNRFVQNWIYHGIETFGPRAYFLHATICFSTVLPAVYSMRTLLGTFPGLQYFLARGPRLPRFRRTAAFLLLLGGCAGFVWVGFAPRWTYPLLWAGPPIVWLALNRLAAEPIPLGNVRNGDWRIIGSWAIAALVCGFFWELWNLYSLAKWTYDIPYLESVKVFEMPLAGYLGYLPFGLACAWATLRADDEDLARTSRQSNISGSFANNIPLSPMLRSHTQILLDSYFRYFREDLIERGPDEAERLMDAPFVVLSHGTEPEPIFNYGNRCAQSLFEMDWNTLTALPSKYSAEPLHREERQKLLSEIGSQGFTDRYRGIRISASGRRFSIESAKIWTLTDKSGKRVGQAATFSEWTFL